MQKPSELMAAEQKPQQNASAAGSALPENWVRALFAKLAVRYGHKWTAQWDGEGIMRLALDEWGRGLAGLTAEDMRRGLDSWNGDWPPSLPEFRKACQKQKEEHWQHRGAAYQLYVSDRRLPKVREDKE